MRGIVLLSALVFLLIFGGRSIYSRLEGADESAATGRPSSKKTMKTQPKTTLAAPSAKPLASPEPRVFLQISAPGISRSPGVRIIDINDVARDRYLAEQRARLRAQATPLWTPGPVRNQSNGRPPGRWVWRDELVEREIDVFRGTTMVRVRVPQGTRRVRVWVPATTVSPVLPPAR